MQLCYSDANAIERTRTFVSTVQSCMAQIHLHALPLPLHRKPRQNSTDIGSQFPISWFNFSLTSNLSNQIEKENGRRKGVNLSSYNDRSSSSITVKFITKIYICDPSREKRPSVSKYIFPKNRVQNIQVSFVCSIGTDCLITFKFGEFVATLS